MSTYRQIREDNETKEMIICRFGSNDEDTRDAGFNQLVDIVFDLKRQIRELEEGKQDRERRYE